MSLAGRRPVKAQESDLKVLRAKIGQLTLENDFLDGALTKAADDQPNPRPARRSALPDPALARSTAYY